jgi:uncharacterized protein
MIKPPSPPAPGKPTRRRRWWRLLKVAAASFVVGYAVLLGAMMFFEESLVFFPSRQPLAGWDMPGAERVRFEAADGARLHGLYFAHPRPRAVALFACGNGGNISYRADRLGELRDRLGVSVLAFDYRGYGLSVGRPNERGVLLDARAARRWLAERTGIAETDVVLWGESLGGGVMVDLASRDGARGLILERTFTSLPDVGALRFPFIPVRLLMRNRLDSLSKIAAYRGPLLACHGDADSVIPYGFGRRLFAAANEPKRFVSLPGIDHNDALPEVWDEALDAFFGSL